MNAHTTDVPYSVRTELAAPPVLVIGDDKDGRERALRTIEAAGYRVADQVGIEDAADRMERQIATSAIWVELHEDRGPLLDDFLDRLSRTVQERRCAAIIGAPISLVDAITAKIGTAEIEIVIDGDDAARAAALAVAVANSVGPHRLSDVSSDRNAERLRQLSDEVSRIASTLSRLSSGPQLMSRPVETQRWDSPEVPAETLRTVIRARRLRSRFFPEELFADPAWDMLLDLLQAEIAQLRVPVSSLCIAAAVPATTALRWLKTMTEQGLFLRRADPHDGRRVFVELAPSASQALRRYFAEVGQATVI
jgi:hypothetical protein